MKYLLILIISIMLSACACNSGCGSDSFDTPADPGYGCPDNCGGTT